MAKVAITGHGNVGIAVEQAVIVVPDMTLAASTTECRRLCSLYAKTRNLSILT